MKIDPRDGARARPWCRCRQLDPLLDDVEERTFNFFWDTAEPGDRPDPRPLADAVVLQHRRGRLRAHRLRHRRRARLRHARARRATRVLTTLRFLRDAPQGDAARRRHRLPGLLLPLPRHADRRALRRRRALHGRHRAAPGRRAVLPASYFDQRRSRRSRDPQARRRALPARRLALGAAARARRSRMGWTPETGFIGYDWRGYNEAMLVYVLALGSPTYPVDAGAWDGVDLATTTRRWGTLYGQTHLDFAPLFGHQYSHVWIDFRGIQDAFMRRARLRLLREQPPRDARAARLRDRAIPMDWRGYGANIWGLTACDGPGDLELTVPRQARASSSATRARGVGLHAVHRRRHHRADRGGRLAAVRARDRDARRSREMHKRYGALHLSASTASSTPSTRASTTTCRSRDGQPRARRRAGSTPTTSASTRARSSR